MAQPAKLQELIDFRSLRLPTKLCDVLAEAFWGHIGTRSRRCVLTQWAHLRVFERFAAETQALGSGATVDHALLNRYIEWLNRQCRANGEPWLKSSRASTFTTLRVLLQWCQRCRPDALGEIEFPFNPFPWRNRDRRQRALLSAAQLRAILAACERDVAALRARRASAVQDRCRARAAHEDKCQSLGAFLEYLDQHFGGILPVAKILSQRGHYAARAALKRYGGLQQVAPHLYPTPATLLPYYLMILIHAAGNPEPIAELACNCLQSLPLMSDRELLLWVKRRASAVQQRSFRSADPFEPPSLVREILAWSHSLRQRAPARLRERLFLFSGMQGPGSLSTAEVKHCVADFTARHSLPHFSLASIRPSVLTAFYRVSGNVRTVQAVANHVSVATTVGYLQNSIVRHEHRERIGALQTAFLGHIRHPTAMTPQARKRPRAAPNPPASDTSPGVTMFGFDCKDPYAGCAPGTRKGELCGHFMGCFTCPNAVIPSDPQTLARLAQARDHLRAAAEHLHPARWQALYAPGLRILEEDILARFTTHELLDAQRLRATLPALPPLR